MRLATTERRKPTSRQIDLELPDIVTPEGNVVEQIAGAPSIVLPHGTN
jgi:hypothetical protein